ncbi:phospholipase A2 inhibitor gamma subunit B-like [Podarcis raffonei]|uniref:phospholipase A2 inhibitor gamma subunit B-like n=1 Tax=Podarcis raffonei TaxID=65483 RepID=UPI002329446D|nr:phospholipase A2 inhibitor gamma subunit B-like [Podarcis raffonei]
MFLFILTEPFSKPLPAPIALLIHLCSESPNLSRMMKALLSASLLLVLLSPGGHRVQLLNKCTTSDSCFSGNYSFTAGDGKFFEMKKHCCNTELCNNATLSLPDRNVLAENGLKCPTCFSKGATQCKSEKTINCLENETQCVVFKGSLFREGVFPLAGEGRPPFISTISRSKAVEQQIFVSSTEENLDLGDMPFLLPKKDVIMLQESHTSLNMKGK